MTGEGGFVGLRDGDEEEDDSKAGLERVRIARAGLAFN